MGILCTGLFLEDRHEKMASLYKITAAGVKESHSARCKASPEKLHNYSESFKRKKIALLIKKASICWPVVVTIVIKSES